MGEPELWVGMAVCAAVSVPAMIISTRRSPVSLRARIIFTLLGLTPSKTMKPPTPDAQRKREKRMSERGVSIPARIRRQFDIATGTRDGSIVLTMRPRKNASGRTMLFLHGGAYCHPFSPFHWSLVAGLARKSGATIVLPFYRLAPCGSWPEAYQLLDRIWSDLTADGSSDIFVVGDSAGGGLALGFVQQLRDEGRPLPQGLVLLSPWLDLLMPDPQQARIDRRDPLLGIAALRLAAQLWARDTDLADPHVSPIYGPLDRLPPTLVLTSDRDLLMPDATRFAQRAKSAKVPVTLSQYPGMVHDWALFPIAEGERALLEVADFMQQQ